MAPEVMLCKSYGLKADTYSFGLFFWHLCTLLVPFGEKVTRDQHFHLVVTVRLFCQVMFLLHTMRSLT